MHERLLPASPNWYCSRCCDVSSGGLLGFGAKNFIYLIDVSAATCSTQGLLVGHKGLVSGVSFCQDVTQSHICASASVDGVILFWDTNTRSLLREHAAHQSAISALHWSPLDKNLVVSGDEKGIVVCHWYNTGDTASFFPEPRSIICLTCSPHNWNTVAVGYKDGMIALIDVSKKGEVTRRLRGHDDDIHSLVWSPLADEDALHLRAEAGDASNGASAGEEKGCYLASGSKDQTVRIWSTATGKGVSTLKLPFVKRRGSAVVDPTLKERLWLNLHWPKGQPARLVSSCFSGELLMWDLTRTGKQRWTLFGSSSEGQNHSRIVFNTAGFTLPDGRQLLVSTSLDREVKCWDLADLDCRWTLPTLGGFVYSSAFSPVASGCLALGVGDNMIRVWNTLSAHNPYDARCFWQGIKSKVTALAWHPKREGTLAFGTDDGKVGIYEVFSSKPPQISSSYHKKTVYSLAWGPPLPPMSFGAAAAAEGKASHSLYSCAGEGVILQHQPTDLSGDACDVDKLIRQTNDIKHKLSPHTDLSWKPDGKVVAIGNEDGCIDIYRAPSLKLVCSIQQHHKVINALRWHPEDNAPPELHGLLASGSCNAVVYVHDLRRLIENPPENPSVLTEPYRRLCGHTNKITGLAWSPHHNARLASASYDGTAQVWDVEQEAALCNYRGHVGYLLSVHWSPVDPDVIWTGGKDFTVQEWRVSKQEFTKPPKGKKMVDLKEKAKQKKKSNKSTDAASPEVNGEHVTNGQGAPDEAEEHVGSTGSPVPPPGSSAPQRKCAPGAKSKDKQAFADSTAIKRKKARSVLPLSTSMDHRPKEDLLQDCLTLASITHDAAPPAGCVAGQGEHVHLGLFSDRAALHRMFRAEEEAHVEGGHVESAVYLRLWSGDLEGALRLAAERGELSDHLIAVAPAAGYAVWSDAVQRYVKQLCLQEQHVKAAAYLLAIDRVYQAVQLLHSHKLHREAIALAKARLPAEDPVLKELYTSWAVMLEKDGHFSAAAKCYIAAGASFDAAKAVARKNDVTSLRTAARLASAAGEVTLAESLALRCAKDSAAARDWVAAQEVLSSHRGLLVHRLHLSVAELLCASLADVLPETRGVGHAWAAPGSSGILERARHVWTQHLGVSPVDSDAGHLGARGHLGALLVELQNVESPPHSASLPLTQVLLCLSRHVARGVLSWLLDDSGTLAKELWLAAAWLREAADFRVSAALFGILAAALEEVDRNVDQEARAAADGLRAWAAYHRLYQLWWRRPADDGDGLQAEGSPEEEESQLSGELDFNVSSLLSDAHAACQAERRATEDLQKRLGLMVAQHGRNMRASDQEQPTEAGGQPKDTFLSLTSEMAQHQRQLAEIPDTIKLYPRPDVVECCLVLLHLGSLVPESPRRDAKDLLRKYGTRPTLSKACRPFLG
ncbi:gem-associated protein 5 isoform X1 [Syngnathus acus]|uniref:gem-associated protein 5 isoform X1 n=1 Tax=Syngnathus acus TaxID=161584 RepID=UPI001885DD5D|nr:gem-associated protein 5 isoform X1 [Syngnathus acus]